MNTSTLEQPNNTTESKFPIENSKEEDQNITLFGISWDNFKTIESSFEGIKSVRLTYLKGVLNIMTIGNLHEYIKTTIGYLLETYMREEGIRFYGRGGFTLRKEGKSSVEPDESYCIENNKEIPDIVIEVVITSGNLNKLDIYRNIAITEVWFLKNNQLQIFQLENKSYIQASQSKLLPNLDIKLIEQYVQYEDQYDAVVEFQQNIRRSKKVTEIPNKFW